MDARQPVEWEDREFMGKIRFGKFNGDDWMQLSDDYLQFLISDKCYTSAENKAKARKVIKEKKKIPGQGRLF